MVGRSTGAEVLGDLVTLSRVGVVANLSDAQLLDRFRFLQGESAEVAFEALVSRHGPMVLDVCLCILGNRHDAQDAFQATFFVLASRARSIRRRDSLASWLLGVARRVALRSKLNAGRRRLHEKQAALSRTGCEDNQSELWAELHEEIDRLPDKYREPVVLCYLEGLSVETAALRLGCPYGTILSRLSRARDRLRGRLTRRGLAPATDLKVDWFSRETARSDLPVGLLDATVRASLRFAEQPPTAAALSSTTAVSLATGAIHAMVVTRLKILCGAALACVLAVGSFHAFARQIGGGAGPRKETAEAKPKSDEPREALVRKSDRLQAGLERSVQLNTDLQKELDELRISLKQDPGSQAATAKATPGKGKARAEPPVEQREEPQASYIQVDDWIVAASTRGDKVVAYNNRSGETRSLRLEGDHVGSQAIPIVGPGVVVYSLGRQVCAFSMLTKRWDVATLPEGGSGTPDVQAGSVIVRSKNHIYIFSSQTGKWKHIDLDAVLTGGGDEETENAKPRK
jgi:RNA polymerase sigma factor (sigma-70 family)